MESRARPELTDPRLLEVHVDHDADARWIALRRGTIRVVANLADATRTVPLDRPATGVRLAFGSATADGHGVHLGAESVAVVTVQG